MSDKILRGPTINPKVHPNGLGGLFFDAGDKFADNICQIDSATGEKETFSSVRRRAIRCAIEMRKRGITKDDIIMECAKNTRDSIIPVQSTLFLIGKMAFIDTTQSPRDCAHAINLVRPSWMFVDESAINTIETALKMTQCTPTIVVMGNSDKYATFNEFQKESPEEEKNFKPEVLSSIRDTAIIYFSSGTTGLPKGICLSHYSLLHGVWNYGILTGTPAKACFHLSSLYWMSAAIMFLSNYFYGSYRVLTYNFEVDHVLRCIQDYEVDYMFMAPVFALKIATHPNINKFDLSKFRILMVGGTPVTEFQMKTIRSGFKDTFVILGYGATEASSCISSFDYNYYNSRREILERKPTSSGKLLGDYQLKIVNIETEELLGPNQKGEIRYKSPFLMNGYFNQDSSISYDSEGFFKSGDIGYYDEDECMYVVDRIKDMFKYLSWHIVPASLEQILTEHEAVENAVVFGIPHDIDGHRPAACITLRAKCKATVEEIEQFYTSQVSDVQKLRGGIKIVDKLILGPTGKILKSAMKDLFLKLQ